MLNRDRFLGLCWFPRRTWGGSFNHRNGLFGAPGFAHPATDALLLIDSMHRSNVSGDGADRADLFAHVDAHTL